VYQLGVGKQLQNSITSEQQPPVFNGTLNTVPQALISTNTGSVIHGGGVKGGKGVETVLVNNTFRLASNTE